MSIIGKYISGEIIHAFVLSLLMYSFVLFIGNILKIIDLLVKGLSAGMIVQFVSSALPFAMAFSVPLAILTAVLFIFGKMSADNEIMALHASGVSFLSIARWPFGIALLICAASWWMNDWVAVKAHYSMRQVKNSVAYVNPVNLLSPGTFVSYFEPYRFYVENVKGSMLYNVIIHEKIIGKNKTRLIKARRGVILPIAKGDNFLKIKLFEGLIEDPPMDESENVTQLNFSFYEIKLDLYSAFRKDRVIERRKADMRVEELRALLRNKELELPYVKDQEARVTLLKKLSELRVEIQQRIAFTLAPLFFVVLGVPLGIIVNRREKSVVVALTFGLAAVYYSAIVLIEGMYFCYDMRPDLLVWVPNMLFGVVGTFLMYKKLCRV